MKIEVGMIFACDTLAWNDGWEFDCPSMMLNPVIRMYENGKSHEHIVEDVLIDAICGGSLRGQDFVATWGWRGYKLPVLRRRFKEALAGKNFPKANYRAARTYVRIIQDPNGDETDMTWEDVPHGIVVLGAQDFIDKTLDTQLCLSNP